MGQVAGCMDPTNFMLDEGTFNHLDVEPFSGDCESEILEFAMGQSGRHVEEATGTQKPYCASTSNFADLTVGWSCVKGCKPKHYAPFNQDDFFVMNLDECTVFCVCDGHGEVGHFVSRATVEGLMRRFGEKYGAFKDMKKTDLKAWVTQAFLETHKSLNRRGIDDAWSGTTCSVVIWFKHRKFICVGHVGDSKCVVGSRRQDSQVYLNDTSVWITKDLTEDHTPELAEEAERIQKWGGILSNDNKRFAIPRSQNWLFQLQAAAKESDDAYQHNGLRRASSFVGGRGAHESRKAGSEGMPSLSITRAMGDREAERMGLSHTPDVRTIGLHDEEMPYCLVLASDGVWTTVNSNECIQIGVQYGPDKVQEAANQIATLAWRRWRTNIDRNGYVDDITAIVAFLV
eukprot:Platyproteum_vivax@DN5289_c0_g1_i2.p1